MPCGDLRSVKDFSGIDIQAEDGLPAGTFPQIKREQSHPAPYIQNGRRRGSKKFVSRLVNSIAPKLAADIVPQPPLRKPGCHARTRTFVFRRVSFQGFHLRRIIALPD
jgi:hypothetical protein